MTDRGRVWLVTGASRGLGRAISEVALEAAETVVATARRAGTLVGFDDLHGSRALIAALDVNDRAQTTAVVQSALDAFGRIDVLVDNAGYGLTGGIEEVTEQQARDQMEVNFFGAQWCTQAVLPTMRRCMK